LEEVVRAVLSHVGEIVCYGVECLVLASIENLAELAAVRAVHVDLLVVESG
jgi:hypothetical protein